MRSKLLTLLMAVAVGVALAAESSVAAFAFQANANKPAAAAKPKAKKRKKPASHAMAMPTDTQGCLNRLATLAAREPLPAYDGEPSHIINDGLLWTSGKCAVSDQAQRLKLADLANKWRMNDAAGVRSSLQEMGATAAPSASGAGSSGGRRTRRGRRTPPAAAAPDTQATPDASAAPATDATSGATPAPHRKPRRPARRSKTANTNS